MPRYAALLDSSCLVDPVLWRVLVGVGVGTDLYRVVAASRSIESSVEVGCRAKLGRGDSEDEIARYREREVAARSTALSPNIVEVDEYSRLESGLADRADAGDAYVVAAALVAGADVIVTHNIRHFHELPGNLTVQHPDEFLVDQLAHAPNAVVRTLGEIAQATRVGNRPPPALFDDLVAHLDHPARAPNFAEELRRVGS